MNHLYLAGNHLKCDVLEGARAVCKIERSRIIRHQRRNGMNGMQRTSFDDFNDSKGESCSTVGYSQCIGSCTIGLEEEKMLLLPQARSPAASLNCRRWCGCVEVVMTMQKVYKGSTTRT